MRLGIIGVILAIILAGGALLFSGASYEFVGKDVMEKGALKSNDVIKISESADAIEKDVVETAGSMNIDAIKKGEVMMRDVTMNEDGAMTPKSSEMSTGQMEKDTMVSHGGTYEAYSPEKMAWAENGKVVLFFRASWCPTCRAVDADIKKNVSSIPKNITILDVNYDTETVLKSKFGVTYQHTFVQVDATGKQIAKWSASPTLAALVTEVQ